MVASRGVSVRFTSTTAICTVPVVVVEGVTNSELIATSPVRARQTGPTMPAVVID